MLIICHGSWRLAITHIHGSKYVDNSVICLIISGQHFHVIIQMDGRHYL
jgi:hypothetical protein